MKASFDNFINRFEAVYEASYNGFTGVSNATDTLQRLVPSDTDYYSAGATIATNVLAYILKNIEVDLGNDA